MLEDDAIQDTQAAIDYYENQKSGLGRKFEGEVNKHFDSLSTMPFYAIR